MSDEKGSLIVGKDGRAGVLLPLIFGAPFDYLVPADMTLTLGDYVKVPFGRRMVWGVVWGEASGEVEQAKLKAVQQVATHLPPMQPAMRDFIDWLAWYTLSPRGQVLKMALPVPDALEPPKAETLWRLAVGTDAKDWPFRPTPARLRIAAYLSDGEPRPLKDILHHARVSGAVFQEFYKAGGAAPEQTGKTLTIAETNLQLATHSPQLSPQQQDAAEALRSKLARGFSVSVLDGVTGSGKTEVYFDTIAESLRQGKQVMVLLPEIALSVQWLARFEKRFGFAPHLWHSSVTPARRRESWKEVAIGNARVVVGARSALFLPFQKLGLIVVDEEHDASYKQEDGVIYQARDMAVVRAKEEKIPILLVSATPSLETEHNIELHRYGRLHLPMRHGEAEMPDIHLIDMREEEIPPGQWISPTLRRAMAQALERGHQSLLFMNRRGYAPLVLCRACGHRFQCPSCSTWLVLHRNQHRLRCHHCDYSAPMPKDCPACKAEDSLLPYGPGVERIAEEARSLFPEQSIGVITSDRCVWHKGKDKTEECAPEELLTAMAEGGIDILIGTQMIAKGHHFARLALVGVIDADMGLAGGDLRAGERTYQLLHQLSGRAGRETVAGAAWLQTYLPDHPVMQALKAGDRDRFMQLEAQMREDAAMPPYGKLASLVIEGPHETVAARYARDLVQYAYGRKAHDLLPQADQHHALPPMILGPAPAPLSRLRGQYRFRVLVKADKAMHLQSFLRHWLDAMPPPKGLRVKVDIDPYSFV